jgi:hypothetical protein
MYTSRYALADDLISHLDTVVPGLDPFLTSRYVGFLCITGVTVFELALRDILVSFATKKHRVFGGFCQDFYERLNGRVTLGDMKSMHIKRFGDKYVNRFVRFLDETETLELRATGRSMRASYGNLITWRHSFAHEGILPANASYHEAKQGIDLGKSVLDCAARALVR